MARPYDRQRNFAGTDCGPCRPCVKSTSASCAIAKRCRTVLVEPPIATCPAPWRFQRHQRSRCHVAVADCVVTCPCTIAAHRAQRSCVPRFFETVRFTLGMRRQQRVPLPGSAMTQRFGQTVHRVRGKHARARATGWARRAFSSSGNVIIRAIRRSAALNDGSPRGLFSSSLPSDRIASYPLP